MAQYLILIYENEADYAAATPEVWDEITKAHGRFGEQIGELGGKFLGGNALQPTQTATTIRSDVVTDGPFVETKEAFGGFYLIDVSNLDDALEFAATIPAARNGGAVEVRPLVER